MANTALPEGEEAYVRRIEANIERTGLDGVTVVRGTHHAMGAGDDSVADAIEARVKASGLEGVSVVRSNVPQGAEVKEPTHLLRADATMGPHSAPIIHDAMGADAREALKGQPAILNSDRTDESGEPTRAVEVVGRLVGEEHGVMAVEGVGEMRDGVMHADRQPRVEDGEPPMMFSGEELEAAKKRVRNENLAKGREAAAAKRAAAKAENEAGSEDGKSAADMVNGTSDVVEGGEQAKPEGEAPAPEGDEQPKPEGEAPAETPAPETDGAA